ncbi:MAG TPA: V-type ATPase subunit [Steroidobacteraceae bacterium]|nr:V-type ATPase subunit [Steroidobacteraceae bacterium]
MNDLLRELAGEGYPSDYLLARVRARRATLAAQWRELRSHGTASATSDEAIWEHFLGELGWLRAQMNRGLRECFAAVFVLYELKTLVLGLRNKAAGREAQVHRLLAGSQLAEPLRRALSGPADMASTVATVAEVIGRDATEQGSLQRAYAEDGLKGLEGRLVRSHLERVADARLHPVLRRFFGAFVDVRNLMSLYKHLRWQCGDAGDFAPGGTVQPARLREVSAAGDAPALDALVRAVAGRAAPPVATSEGALETILLDALTRTVRELGQADGEVGVLLDYLWRLYVHARNRAVLFHAGDLEAAALERELIA